MEGVKEQEVKPNDTVVCSYPEAEHKTTKSHRSSSLRLGGNRVIVGNLLARNESPRVCAVGDEHNHILVNRSHILNETVQVDRTFELKHFMNDELDFELPNVGRAIQ